MNGLKWWMRIVGAFYLLQFVVNAIVKVPIRTFGPKGALAQEAAGDPMARFLVDTWVVFGLEIAAIGIALLIFSRKPEQAKALVWAVIAVEVLRGIVADTYMISRGLPLIGLVIWIVIHTVTIVTGLFFLREARSASREQA